MYDTKFIGQNGWCDECNIKTMARAHFDEEMSKLEQQQNQLRDQYNTTANDEFNVHEYQRKLRASSTLKYAWQPNEKLSRYIVRLTDHVDEHADKNIATHVKNNGRGCWFTHKEKFGACFMCADLRLYSYLFMIVQHFANKYPDEYLPE